MILTALLEWLAAVALILLCAIGALFTRRVVIRRRGGTFDCSLRLTPGSAWAAVHFGPAQAQAEARGPADAGGAPHASRRHREPYEAADELGTRPMRHRNNRAPLSAAGVRAGRGWSYGIAQYENDRIDWYRIFSYAYRPAAVLTRRDLEVVGRRDAENEEELALFPGWTVVECKFGTGLVELAMSPDALTGFLSWLEAAPPGQDVGRVS